MQTDIISFLSQYYPISENLKERLLSILKIKALHKKSFLLTPTQTSNHIYFIEKGFVRIYYLKNGEEICSGLLFEGSVVLSVHSFFNREPSHEYIQCVEDTALYYISHEELESLYKDFIEFNVIGRKLITAYYVMSEERLYFLRKQKAAEKLLHFRNKFGDTIGRIPRKDIASYLGINLETLSRL